MNSIFIILISIYFSFIHCDNLSFQEILFKNIMKIDKKNNVLISPFSIYEILSLVTNGAVNETQKEMLKVLIPYKEIDNKTLDNINSNLINIIEKINNENKLLDEIEKNYNETINEYWEVDKKTFILENANAIFINKTLKILDEFSSICDSYKADTFELESVKQVNDWGERKNT